VTQFALVTGGSSGIGAVTCQRFLEAGYRVISFDREPAASAPAAIQQVIVDLSDPEATRAAVREVVASVQVTTVVHNAGAVRERELEAVTLEDLTALSHLHVAAAISLVQGALPAMKAQHFGRIVLIASRAVLGLARRTVYASTKAALLGLARTWALELGVHGVTVNVVAPGPIAGTRVFHDIIPADSPKLPSIIQAIPVKRLGRPEDVARAILFFASPDAGFLTGQTLYVCGGTSIGSIVY